MESEAGKEGGVLASGEGREEMEELGKRFGELERLLHSLDHEDGSRFLPVLARMPLDEVYSKIDVMHGWALRLDFEQARELERGTSLGVFDSGGDAAAAAGGAAPAAAPSPAPPPHRNK